MTYLGLALSSDLFEFITHADDTTLTSTLNNVDSPDDRTKSNNINIELNRISD